jgi:hypothetical protein
VIGARVGSGFETKAGLGMIGLLLSRIIGGPMLIVACIVGGLIVASTVFALFVASGPEVTLSDIARQMDKMHGSQTHNEL